jgi:hypothetical protein
MDEWPPFVPYLILAAICGLASVEIVGVALFFIFSPGAYASGTAMIAVAASAFAPAVMGIGIASFMPRDRH